MKRTLKLQFVSLFLSVVIVFCSIPAFAVPQEGSDFIPPTQITTNAEEGTEQQSVQPVLDDEEMIEEVHLRDAFSKHYRKSNGEYYAVIYPEPVHYFKDDAWEEVDNTLIYQPASQKYSASSYQFSADFASSATSEELITFSDGEYSISWGIRFLEEESDLVATASASIQSDSIASAIGGTISAAPAVVSAEASQGALGKAVSQISYQNVFQNAVSLRYSVAYGRVEEDIILSSAQDFTSYQLVFQTNGLTLAKQEDNQIHFLNADQEVVFRLDAPWMKDANASFSDAFEVSVLQKGSLAVVNYVPNAQWLQDEARVFPVLIDPSFTTRQYTSNYEDTYVVEDEGASATRATSQTLVVGNQNGKKHAAYLKVLNLPSCFDWDTVTQFDLEFYVNGTSSPALSVSEVIEDWAASSITYANQPNTLLVETDLVATDSKYVVDLMEMWTYWGQEDISFDEHMHFDFYGFKIEYTNQTLTNNYASICSSEYSEHTNRPIIKVSYSATPSEVFEDGAVYRFINSASDQYLTVDASAAAYSNVYQYQMLLGARQAFRLIADDDGNGFAISPVQTLNNETMALCFDSDGIYSSSNFTTANVEINSYPSSYTDIEHLWSIEFVTQDTVRIVPYQNARYALTANATSGNVYIGEYTGAANQLWYVESGEKELKSDAHNIKSTTSLTVAEDRISVPYIACPAIDHNSTVAFYSSNTSVATINQTGAIDIKKAGITTITAVLEDDDDNLTNYTLTLYVTLPNGTYYFNNVSNSYRIDLNNGSTEENEQLQLWNSGTNDSGHRDQLYKIKHLGSGVYSIRSMVDNSMGWTRLGSSLVNATIGASDTNLSTTEKWVIDSNANGYYIYNAAGNRYTVTAPSSVSNGTKIVLDDYSNTNTGQNWTLQKTSRQIHDVFIDNEITTLVKGSQHLYKVRFRSTAVGVNGQLGYNWSISSGGSHATVDTSGRLIAVSLGTVTVKVSSKHNSSWSAETTLDIIPIKEGVHFFENAETNKFMQPDDNSDDEDVNVHMEQHSFSGAEIQRWELIYCGNQCYQIKNVESGELLTAPEAASNNAEIVQAPYSASLSERQLWIFTNYEENCFEVQPKIRVGSGLVLAVGAGMNEDSNGINIEQRSGITDRKDEWFIHDESNYAYKPLQARIFYDPDCGVSASQLQEYYEDAAEKIKREFYIEFVIQISLVEEKQELSCSRDCDAMSGENLNPSYLCTSECGSFSSCNTTHHRSGVRLLDLFVDSDFYTCRITAYKLCKWENATHKSADGCAKRNGKDIVVYCNGEGTSLTIQHELTHNLGADDYENGQKCSSLSCIMNESNSDTWCSYCENLIRTRIQNGGI